MGLNAQELLRRLSESPSALLADGDRAGALAAARRARKAGTPLQRVCRAVSGDGRELRLSLHVTWAPQADGTCLICAACADITQEAADGEASRRRAQLCDLLLEHSSLLTLDYDPAADLARIERYGAGGRRTFRMVSGYLKSLASASYLHPEDRRRLASAVRRAVSKPGTISCTYRADYEGTGWRWYQVSWMSLFDENGDVGRLLGKAEDVTASRAAAEHYRRLAARHRRQARTFLAAARLDLTADQTLDAKAAARHLLRALFERTAAACLQRIAAAVPDEAQRAQFHSLFSPEALAEAYGEGDFRRTLDHTLDAGRGPLPVRTAIELSENPDTSHLEAFVQMQDLRPEQEREALLGALAGRDYLLVITVDAAGKIRVWGPPEAAPADGASCRSLAVWYLRQLPPSPERTALRRALRPEALQARLAASPAAELTLPGLAGLPVILRCSALESPPGTLLVTCRAAELPPAMFSPEK